MLEIILSKCFRLIGRWRYTKTVDEVIFLIREISKKPPLLADLTVLKHALVLAEDHRFYSHLGFDSRSIARAALINLFTCKIQGASTITQQLVRVLTAKYDKNISRKFKEICLASVIDSHFTKDEQATAYLHVAYFGWRMTGINQASSRLGYSSPYTASQAASLVARLKYPEPQFPSEERTLKIQDRTTYILRMMSNGE